MVRGTGSEVRGVRREGVKASRRQATSDIKAKRHNGVKVFHSWLDRTLTKEVRNRSEAELGAAKSRSAGPNPALAGQKV